MKIVVLPVGAIVVKEDETFWLFDCPEGTSENLKRSGLPNPQVVLMTQLRAPGLYDLSEPVMSLKERPLNMNGLKALPLKRKHGTDYQISSKEGRVLYSSRGDVSVEDVEGYDLVIIKNKHRADAFGDNVITWPWIEAEYDLKDSSVQLVTREKVWDTLSEVPANIKKIEGTPLTLAQANVIARIAEASGEGEDKENFAIAISQFKKGHMKKGDIWVVRKEADTAGNPIRRFGDVLTAALHKAYNDTSDFFFSEGFLDQDERLTVAHAIEPGLKKIREGLPEEVLTRVVKEDEEAALNEGRWTTVWKDDNGVWNWASISSYTMLDKHQEVLTPKAMRWGIKFGEVMGRGPLRYKHFPGFDGGDCTQQVEVGGYLFEKGTFRDTPLGTAMRRKMQKDPTVQVSLGLMYNKKDLLRNMFYTKAFFFERSLTKQPAVPVTAVITSGGIKMNVEKLTDEQLEQTAKELELPLDQVKALHEQALANSGLPSFTQKEFSEAVLKAQAQAADEDDDDVDDDDEEEEEEISEAKAKQQVKVALAEMDVEERKQLQSMLDDADADSSSPFQVDNSAMVKAVKENTAILKKLLTVSSESRPVSDRLATIFAELPRRQQPAFLTGLKEGGTSPDGKDAEILTVLKEVQEHLKKSSTGGADFYDRFTSETLNDGFKVN